MQIPFRRPDRKALLDEADHFLPAINQRSHPPLVGISAHRKENASCIAEAYVQSVLQAGGTPLLIPVLTDLTALTTIVNQLDALLLSGGADLNPLYWGEEPIPQLGEVDAIRDEYDLILLRLAFRQGLPILGICRGHQLINVAFGGSLYQDIAAQHEGGSLKHSQASAREWPSHTVTLTDRNSKLYAILKNDKVLANSFHHQAVKELAPGFVATAFSADHINEAMEHPEYPILSVQWHPETMATHGDECMKALFRHHVEEATLFAQAKDLHRRILTVDLHTDAPMVYAGAFDLGKRIGGAFQPPFTEGKVNLPLMEQGRLDATFIVAYIPQGERTEAAFREVYLYTLDRLMQIKHQQELHPTRVGIARTPYDMLQLKQEGKKAFVMGVENAYVIGKDIHRLKALKRIGVAYVTLCHNGNNDICDSSQGEPEWQGLSPFGREVVREMNRLGILVDVSHAAESTFYDVLQESRAPVIASHSSVRALCDHPRNLTDRQIQTLAANGGVVNICLYAGFLRQGAEMGEASLSDAIRHIRYVVNLVGIDHVGIGSDFDGGGELAGCWASNELIHLTTRLLKEGYREADIQKIWGGNLLRVMNAVQSAAEQQ
ncbi:MAG: gamma-glutamyl-gamma-aminobutyrate hydrolase family protein [Tannerellaceae bacterium]|jgi:microsomal dipeptidase-like Zn-dependent dipeptidase/gamma-glutamyl-gamma-aminobutyrate hydrolase PuuD|nr:gamma-glutamyl-gamma-aminobutyrate hydrolase family protein [Tannerellaceae bacterium]